MVEPTKRKPRLARSLLIASEISVVASTGWPRFRLIGLPLTKLQIYLSKLPHYLLTWRNALALLTAELILSLFLIIPSSFINSAIFRSSYFAIFFGLKRSNAFR